jgi:hypothetical protein
MLPRNRSLFADGLIVLVAIGLYVSPWLFNYGGDAGWNATISAGVVAALAAVHAYNTIRPLGTTMLQWLDWLTGLVGAWLVVAPWIIGGFEDAAKWTSVAAGVAIAILAFAAETVPSLPWQRHEPTTA